MQVKIVSAQVVVGHTGPDHVFLQTELPDSMWPYTGKLILRFDAASESGADYVRKHFGIEPEVIDVPKP